MTLSNTSPIALVAGLLVVSSGCAEIRSTAPSYFRGTQQLSIEHIGPPGVTQTINAGIEDVLQYCDKKVAGRDSAVRVTKELTIAGIVFGGIGTAGSGVSAAISNTDVKTGIAIGAAVISATVTALSAAQLIYRPATTGDVADIFSAEAMLETSIAAANAAAVRATKSTADVDTAEKALAEARKLLQQTAVASPPAPAERLANLTGFVKQAESDLNAKVDAKNTAERELQTAQAAVQTGSANLRTKCSVFGSASTPSTP